MCIVQSNLLSMITLFLIFNHYAYTLNFIFEMFECLSLFKVYILQRLKLSITYKHYSGWYNFNFSNKTQFLFFQNNIQMIFKNIIWYIENKIRTGNLQIIHFENSHINLKIYKWSVKSYVTFQYILSSSRYFCAIVLRRTLFKFSLH